MKKTIIILICLTIFLGLIGNHARAEAEIKEGVVVQINYEQDEFIVLELDNGELWIYKGIEDWLIWDKVAMIFLNGAPSDIIIYIGWCDPIAEKLICCP